MGHFILITLLLSLGLPSVALAACPAAPSSNSTDMIMRFVAPSGSQAGTMLSSSVPDKTAEGTFIYDTTNKTLKLCNGTTWLEIGPDNPAITALTGDVSASGTGSVTATLANNAVITAKIANSAVTNAKLANMAAQTIKGNRTASAAAPTDITVAQLMNMIIPTGAIWAFDLTTCPTGWAEYTPARGRFLRGIDNGAGNDPSGTRAPGNAQADAIIEHTHGGVHDISEFYTGGANRPLVGAGTRHQLAMDNNNLTPSKRVANIAGGYIGAAETRPKNVAVLFCRKT